MMLIYIKIHFNIDEKFFINFPSKSKICLPQKYYFLVFISYYPQHFFIFILLQLCSITQGRRASAKAENKTLARLFENILKKRRKQPGINQEQFSALMEWRATAVME